MARLNYLNAANKKYLPPPIKRTSLFGWIPVIYKITEDEVIQYAGLDAYVFLGFFKMSIKLLSLCCLFSAVVISPVRYYFTGDYDDDNQGNSGNHSKHNGTSILGDPKFSGNSTNPMIDINYQKSYLALYVIFTFVFTYWALQLLLAQAAKVIKKRQEVLGHQSSVTDRTIRLTGIPPELRSQKSLKNAIDSLSIGKAEKIVICKEWKMLDRLYKQRADVMEKLECAWAEYLSNDKDHNRFNVRPFASSSYLLGNTTERYSDNPPGTEHHYLDNNNDIEAQSSNASNGEDQGSTAGIDSASSYRKRPIVRLGPFHIWGRKVDAIDHYTHQLRAIDAEILAARQRHYPATPTAFVTLDSVAAAQMFAQAVVDPRIGYLISRPAPAPRDIIWENLTLPRRTRNFKQGCITVITGLLGVIFIVPVGYLATLLNMKTIRKFWPALGQLLDHHPWAQDFVIDLLPVYLYTLLNFVIPYVYVWLSSKQAFISHGEEELSVVSKNFFYVFVNMFLVFTMAGTASNYWGYLSDSKKLALQLAASLRGLSAFYVDTIILQGVGLHPFKLLLMGQLFRFPFGRVKCKTPRHYMNLYKPPNFNFGLNLPVPMLTLIITLLYSVMSIKILSAGLLYFIIGFYVYKFQLIYSSVHPQHSTGQVMPIIFRRVAMGLLLFQLTVSGTLALSNAWVLSLLITPLPFITLYVWWYFEKNYQPLSYFIALRAIEKPGVISTAESSDYSSRSSESNNTEQQLQHRVVDESAKDSTIDERRELNQTYSYPNLIQTLDGPWLSIEGNEVVMASTDGIERKKLTVEEY